MKRFTLEQCNRIMKTYGLPDVSEVEMIDSSRGDHDIRHNYIVAVSSPYKRSLDTIKAFTDKAGIQIRTDERFREQ